MQSQVLNQQKVSFPQNWRERKDRVINSVSESPKDRHNCQFHGVPRARGPTGSILEDDTKYCQEVDVLWIAAFIL